MPELTSPRNTCGGAHHLPWIRHCSLCTSPYSSAKWVLDPSRVNPPGCNIVRSCRSCRSQHSLGVRSEEEGWRPGWGSGTSQEPEAALCSLPPALSEAPPASDHRIAEKGLQTPSSPGRGPAGWGPGDGSPVLEQLPREADLHLPPPPPRQKRGPHDASPSPIPTSATHLPEPAVANLLQVQEAVPAQVCGLEQLYCNRAGSSETSAQPRPPRPSSLIRPLEALSA